jgi:hypothetical protein
MNGREYMKITSEPLSLVVEKIGEDILTPMGSGTAYSLFFCFELPAETTHHSEMCFLTVETADQYDPLEIQVIPFMFQHVNLEIFQESIEFHDQIMGEVDTKMQAGHAELANMWIGSLKMQGF